MRSKNKIFAQNLQKQSYLKKRELNYNDDLRDVNVANELEQNICFMKNKVVNSENDKNEIIDSMKETYSLRRSWIETNKPSLTEILTTFVKFCNYRF